MLATATAMKPRPAGCKAAAKGSGLVGAACGGWARRPRPRARSAALSPKCSAAAPAGTVHSESEHRRRRVPGVLLRPVRLPGTEYGSELERRVEKFIYACRFMTFLAIGGSLVGSIPCFLKVPALLHSLILTGIPPSFSNLILAGILQGCVYVMDAFIEYYLHGGTKVTLMLVEAIGNHTDSNHFYLQKFVPFNHDIFKSVLMASHFAHFQTCFLLERSCLSSGRACTSSSSVTPTTLMVPTSLACSSFRSVPTHTLLLATSIITVNSNR